MKPLEKLRDDLAKKYVAGGYGCDGDTSADSFRKGFDAAIRAFDSAFLDGGYNSAWSMICLMAEGEGSDAEIYQSMAKTVHAKLREIIDEKLK